MTTKLGRHKGVEVECEYCGKMFMARASRVAEGRGRFCSRSCGNKGKVTSPLLYGKENGTVYKQGNRLIVRWYSKDGKMHNTSYGKWMWEKLHGVNSIPKDYRVGFKDNNPLNEDPNNLYLQSPKEYGRKQGKRLKGIPKSEEHKKSMRKPKNLSKKQRDALSDRSRKLWEDGVFDDVHYGENNSSWKGGVSQKYPREFYKLRFAVKDRDNHVCQICGKNTYRSRYAHVHHIDGDKQNNDMENLILLCIHCHSKVHHVNKKSPPVFWAFHNKLKY